MLSMNYAVWVMLGLSMGFSMSLYIRALLVSHSNADDTYYALLTLHGLYMIFMYLMPILYGVFGNYYMAHQSGVSDMIYPRFNIYALQVIIVSLLLMTLATLVSSNSYYGWTMYPPISNTQYVEVMILSLHLSGLSSILTSLNLMYTT